MGDLGPIVQHIQALSSEKEQLGDILVKSERVIASNTADIPAALTSLRLPGHTLGFCWLLGAKAEKARPEEAEWFMTTASTFIAQCSEDSLNGAQFAKICTKLAELAISSGQSKAAIVPLREAIHKLQPSPECLTPVHVSLIQVCLKAKMYHVALPFAEQRVTEVEPHKTGLVARDILLFFLYAGRVQIGVKQIQSAFDCFQQALTMPCTCVNAIMVEIYKKYVLVSLLATGSGPILPKYTSQLVQRHVKNLCALYDQLATVYATHSPTEFSKAIDDNIEKIREDGNEGLVRQCLKSLSTGNIKRLTQTYVTLSLEDIASSAHLENGLAAEMKVLDMISQSQIFARINQADGMVSFLEDPEEYNSNAMMDKLDNRISSNSDLCTVLSNLNCELACDPDYISKTMDRSRSGPAGHDEASTNFGY